MDLNANNGKKAAAEAAVQLIQDGMTIGLGTGTTATYFIKKLGEKCQKGLKVKAVASSRQSADLAHKWQIPLIDIDQLTILDVAVDGADEIDPQKRMIKGGGGALLREKIVASMSQEMIVVVDSSKCVENLGKFPLPIEIIPFARKATIHHLEALGLKGAIRCGKEDSFYVTDNGNYIFDVAEGVTNRDLEELNVCLLAIPGVLETGLFFDLAGQVIVGYSDGSIKFY